MYEIMKMSTQSRTTIFILSHRKNWMLPPSREVMSSPVSESSFTMRSFSHFMPRTCVIKKLLFIGSLQDSTHYFLQQHDFSDCLLQLAVDDAADFLQVMLPTNSLNSLNIAQLSE